MSVLLIYLVQGEPWREVLRNGRKTLQVFFFFFLNLANVGEEPEDESQRR